ncbi:Chromate resistance protein ChrB [Kribbella sp.]|uniref:Chromate resistance protein ChrB n=1 Tax=Kribbella sp. TaxID=1871183 RepID=UPI002D263057|nr:Chromate resistance protein ChrB [Kribbella sp.]HZX01819.1 Chromate resistance protein ChrB [Kribbella sp.]
MTDRWLVLLVRIPAEPTRHRVAVWRELRKAGALSLGQGIWALPELPVFEAAVQRTTELVARAEGELTMLEAAGRDAADGARLRGLYDEARRADWTEFLADCGKFEDEIAKEIRIEKFTLAELEEEEQSLERLRRWHRDLTSRDVFGTPEAAEATARLKDCVACCEEYAELVFRALHQLPGDAR